jgi:hypothetical protein
LQVKNVGLLEKPWELIEVRIAEAAVNYSKDSVVALRCRSRKRKVS